jgi:hypothetical protein
MEGFKMKFKSLLLSLLVATSGISCLQAAEGLGHAIADNMPAIIGVGAAGALILSEPGRNLAKTYPTVSAIISAVAVARQIFPANINLEIVKFFIKQSAQSFVRKTGTDMMGGGNAAEMLNMFYLMGGGAQVAGIEKAKLFILLCKVVGAAVTYKLVKNYLAKLKKQDDDRANGRVIAI